MKMRSTLIAGLAVLVASAAVSAADSSVKANATAGEGALLVGTLAPYGSFDFLVAPSYTKVIVVSRTAQSKLRKREITATKAEEIHRKASAAKQLLDEAMKVCRQDNKTGVCKGDARKANVLLTEANAKLAAL